MVVAPPSKTLRTVKRTATQGATLLSKAKNKENPVSPASTSLADTELYPTEIKSFRGEPMLLHDNSDPRRLIMFGTQTNLDQLMRCPSWYIDSPLPFPLLQLMVAGSTSVRLSTHEMNIAYESTTKDLNIGRYVPSEVRVWVRRLMMLPFIPVDDVPSAFHLLFDLIPDNLGLDPFLGYFMFTWIEGLTTGTRTAPARFPPSSWNAYDRTSSKLNRANNFLESRNKEFAAKVGQSKPTMWSFRAAIYLEQSYTDEKVLKEAFGDPPEARKKKHTIKDRRILYAVERYDPETVQLVE